MRILTFLAVFILSGPILAQESPSPASDSPLLMPTDWEALYVSLIYPGTVSRETLGDEAFGELMSKHIQFQLGLQHEGNAVAAGGVLPDSTSTSRLVGITLLRAPSIEEAKKLAETDPAVIAGYYSVEVRTWYIPAGKIPDPGP